MKWLPVPRFSFGYHCTTVQLYCTVSKILWKRALSCLSSDGFFCDASPLQLWAAGQNLCTFTWVVSASWSYLCDQTCLLSAALHSLKWLEAVSCCEKALRVKTCMLSLEMCNVATFSWFAVTNREKNLLKAVTNSCVSPLITDWCWPRFRHFLIYQRGEADQCWSFCWCCICCYFVCTTVITMFKLENCKGLWLPFLCERTK